MNNTTMTNWARVAKELGLDGRHTVQTLWQGGRCEACGCVIERDGQAYVFRAAGIEKPAYRPRYYLHPDWHECGVCLEVENGVRHGPVGPGI